MGIYKKIFQKLTGREDKPKKKRLKMATTATPKKQRKPIFKKLTPEQKKKALEAFKKAAGTVVKYSGGKPQVKVKAAPQPKQEKQPGVNFWNNKIDMGFIQPTGKQLVIGTATAAVIGGLAYKTLKK